MKVLVIGSDKSVLRPGTAAFERRQLQAAQVERYTVLTPRSGEGKLAAALRMRREAKKEEFDTVTAQDPFLLGLLAYTVAHRAGARLNLQVHTDLASQSFFKRLLARFLLRRADSVRVVSERIKKQVTAAGVHAPVSVLPVFIDVSRFQTLVRRPHDAPTLLWIGRFEPEKDPLYALQVFKHVRDAVIGAKLVMLGAGSLEQALRDKAADLGLAANVEFPGWGDPAECLAVADAVLSTSRFEGFGASIVEALAAGVPVVAPDVGVAAEAGATVVPRAQLAEAAAKAIHSSVPGSLKLNLLSKEEWAQAWLKTL